MVFAFYRILLFLFSFHCFALADEPEKPPKESETSQKVPAAVRTMHTLSLNGSQIEYEAICDSLPISGSDEKPKAHMFFTAYCKKGSEDNLEHRPLIFCFNGGPGSSSIWLHMGLLGPKRVVLQDCIYNPPPSRYEDNPYAFLDIADLVFIDPVSTGFSVTSPGVDSKQFHSIEGDVDSFAEFIRRFLTRFDRWQSPRYLLGESYGTVRAVGLANHLHDTYFIDMNGVVLISMCLDFQAYDFGNGNDLPCILNLPTYAATAWYHKKLSDELQKKSLPELLAEVEDFAVHEYATALLLGDQIDNETRDDLTNRLSQYTGLTPECVKGAHLRIIDRNFSHDFLQNELKILGRFDSRYVGYDSNHYEEPMMQPDPSFDAIIGAFNSSFNQYLIRELKVERSEPYYVLNAEAVFPWNFSTRVPAGLGYVYLSGKLRTLLERNPTTRIFVASGLYDLATPYYATNYTLNHLRLAPSLSRNIVSKSYEAGHMMYLKPSVHEKLRADLVQFISTSSKPAEEIHRKGLERDAETASENSKK
jgi:carboxypeptidase C (cathepsin A)